MRGKFSNSGANLLGGAGRPALIRLHHLAVVVTIFVRLLGEAVFFLTHPLLITGNARYRAISEGAAT